jgi:hypothetical protein
MTGHGESPILQGLYKPARSGFSGGRDRPDLRAKADSGEMVQKHPAELPVVRIAACLASDAVKVEHPQSNARVPPWLQRSCKEVAGMLQACCKPFSLLSSSVPGRGPGVVQPPSGDASRSTQA